MATAHLQWWTLLFSAYQYKPPTQVQANADSGQMYAAYGLPSQIVSDDEPQFLLQEFASFMKSLEIKRMSQVQANADSGQMYAAYGLPSQIVSDDEPQFLLQEFASFMKSLEIKRMRSAHYNPDRFIQSFKQSMKATICSGFSLNQRVSNFLEVLPMLLLSCFIYTVHASTAMCKV